MTRQERPFVRVYHDDLQRDYEAVWDDDHLMATWLRLLVVADKLWPSDGEIPRGTRPRPLAALVKLGLVLPRPSHRFRLKGLDADRQRRVDAARYASGHRWPSDPDTDSNADGTPARTPPRSPDGNPSHGGASPSAMALGAGMEKPTDEDVVLIWLASVKATVQPNGNGHHRDLVGLVARHGVEPVLAAMKGRYAAGDRAKSQLIYGAANELEPIHRPGGAKKGQAVAGDMQERIDAFPDI